MKPYETRNDDRLGQPERPEGRSGDRTTGTTGEPGDRYYAGGPEERHAQERAENEGMTTIGHQAPPPSGHQAPQGSATPGGPQHAAPAGGHRPASGGGRQSAPGSAGTASDDVAQAGPLLPGGAHDKLHQRLEQTMTLFVDHPRQAVEDADGVYEELTALLTEALAARRRALRTAWEAHEGGDTEALRVALRQYRDLTRQLLAL
ncbi:hypothetical protein [Streptomyces sp. NPDC003077]|uniref:hypothetical protein n=1 Tax=Streptomyces sp. NPDC003077 TaxID=3154443 RepID=UPI0033A0935D